MNDSNFRWYSEEDGEWPGEPMLASPPATIRSRRPLFLLLIALLIGGAGLVGYRRLNQQLAETTKTIEADVLASHNLLRRAAADRDLELFITALSGGDARWADAQQQLVQEGAFLNRPAFSFELASSTAVRDAAITLAPDLNTAVLTHTVPYLAVDPAGVTQTIRLRQTAVYRRGSQNWLIAPPGPDFWGETMTQHGRYLTLSHPARDEAVAAQLAADLDQAIGRLCRAPQLPCPAEPLQVHLDPAPNSLATLSDPRRLWRQSVSSPLLVLPAPTLVGLPAADAAYQALFRGYARHTLTTVILREVGYQCCHGQIFYRALLDQILNDAGLAPPPLTPAAYQRLLTEETTVGLSVITLSNLWEMPLSRAQEDEHAPLAHALLTFATENNMALTPYSLLASLAETDDYAAWTRPFLTTQIQGVADLRQSLDGRWRRFLYRRAAPAAAPPVPWPEDEIAHLLCQGALLQHDPTNDRLTALIDDGQIDRMAPLAARQGVFWFGRRAGDEGATWQAGFTQRDQITTVYTRPVAPSRSFYAASLDDNGRHLLIQHSDLTGGDRPAQRFNYGYVDLAACAAGGDCQPHTLTAPAVWSPDGNYALLHRRSLEPPLDSRHIWYELALGNASGERQQNIGVGRNAFWLDAQTFGFIGVDETGRQTLQLGSVAGPTPRPALAWDELSALLLPLDDRPRDLEARALFADPAAPHLIWLLAFDYATSGLDSPEIYLFAYNRTTDQASLRATDATNGFLEAWGTAFSPHGRWLALLLATRYPSRNKMLLHLYLHDREKGTTEETTLETRLDFFVAEPDALILDWSRNGRWLAVPTRDGYRLIHPESGYQRTVITGYTTCTAVAWAGT